MTLPAQQSNMASRLPAEKFSRNIETAAMKFYQITLNIGVSVVAQLNDKTQITFQSGVERNKVSRTLKLGTCNVTNAYVYTYIHACTKQNKQT